MTDAGHERTTPETPTVVPGGTPPESGKGSELPHSSLFSGEDFLFHLYRGSELLQDNCVEEAKEELERALELQPRDIEGQGLLGVVYFRLGLYPRAIVIYDQIVRECPEEVTPKLNLALCYLKTGQPAEARDLLEEIVRRVSDHPRAWVYLGLAFDRLGRYEEAQAAFDRAGQPHLARRMRARGELSILPVDDQPARDDLRRAAADAVQELEMSAEGAAFSHAHSEPADARAVGRWQAREPGQEHPQSETAATTATAPLFSRVSGGASSTAALIAGRGIPELSNGVGRSNDGLVFIEVRESLALRTERLRALSPGATGLTSRPLFRRLRGRDTEEPFGAPGSSWLLVEGSGLVLLEPPRERELVLLELSGDFVYVRHTRLVGFHGLLRYENGRLPASDPGPVPMVQLAGRGVVVFEAHSTLRALAVTAARPLTVRAASVLGWTGRLVGQALPSTEAPSFGAGFVAFNGEGAVLVDDP